MAKKYDGVIEAVRVDDFLGRNELEISASKRVVLASREVGERHSVGATRAGVEFVDLAGEAMGWQPLNHCIRV